MTEKTLRDELAMAALTGMCAAPVNCYVGNAQQLAEWAYQQADAMLAARQTERTTS